MARPSPPFPPAVVRALAVVAGVALALPPHVAAADPPGPPPSPDAAAEAHPAEPWLDDPRVHPDAVTAPADSAAFREAAGRYEAAIAASDAAARRADEATREIGDLRAARERLRAERIVTQRRHDKSVRNRAELHDAMVELAVAEYVQGRTGSPVDASMGLDLAGREHRRARLVTTVHEDRRAAVARHTGVIEETAVTLDRLDAELAALAAALTAAEDRRARATAERDEAWSRALRAAVEAADARLLAPIADTEMTLVVFDAYVRAAATAAEEHPQCGLHWSLLAGIGRIESRHGTFGGSTVDAEGDVTVPIIGIPLDGTDDTMRIPDTDGGELDGDPVYDRAVGPMQFIPGTWRTFGRDATGDGTADPQNYYDAALSAADYLCAFGPGLDHEAGARRAALAYNFSGEYVAAVLTHAGRYATLELQ